nr:hypothetical protein [Kibdelosporangium sp. MJ126-NF4]CEL13206.1 non-ribosomal peptide synthetase [Kibdelosporangium sp. MJ126-NF4]CTQ98896.1 non-ribosomal peptide synthetase [Kibdelosporangium sp. MJ126-NF4]
MALEHRLAVLRALRHDARQAEEWTGACLSGDTKPGRRLREPVLCVVGERDRSTELYEERHREWGMVAEHVEDGARCVP